MFLATHSLDVLQGVLSESTNITIVRLTRKGTVNHAAVLDNDRVKRLWSDSLLRYSNILDGLVHELVVVCEADSDCRFYASILNALLDQEETEGRRPEVLFTHCGGYQRMHVAISALRAVNVPVRAVVDFDVLRESENLRRIVKALDGDWSTLEEDHRILAQALGSAARVPRREYVRERLAEVLDVAPGKITVDEIRAIHDLIRTTTGWDDVKRKGKAALPSGDPTKAFNRLDEALQHIGLFIVPEGELEGFDRTVGNHGPAWVAEVHRLSRHLSTELSSARQFVRGIVLERS